MWNKKATSYTSREYLELLLEKRGLELEVTDSYLNIRIKEDKRLILQGDIKGTIDNSCRQLTTLIVRTYGNKDKGRKGLLQGRN